ncbi:hypothetical protein FKM82_007604 [Ascaphus truei]
MSFRLVKFLITSFISLSWPSFKGLTSVVFTLSKFIWYPMFFWLWPLICIIFNRIWWCNFVPTFVPMWWRMTRNFKQRTRLRFYTLWRLFRKSRRCRSALSSKLMWCWASLVRKHGWWAYSLILKLV